MSETRIDAIANVLPVTHEWLTGGQPKPDQLAALATHGYQVVINLAEERSPGYLPDEEWIVARLGMRYEHLPISWDAPSEDGFASFSSLLDTYAGQRIFVHCAANMRVSAMLYLYRIVHQGIREERARADLNAIWAPNETWRALVEQILRGAND